MSFFNWLIKTSVLISISITASSTGFSYFFLARLGDWERARRRERELVAIEEHECRERWEGEKEGVSSPPHDSLRPSSLVNYYMYYSRAGDWGRGSFDKAFKGTHVCHSRTIKFYFNSRWQLRF